MSWPGSQAREVQGRAQTAESFGEADVDIALRAALRLILLLATVGAVVIWISAGWQTASLFAVGALISAVAVGEWRTLARVLDYQFAPDEERSRRLQAVSSGWALARFFLRLLLVAVALYVSLKCLHGSVYALLAGLGLAIIAITWQALRLLARWR